LALFPILSTIFASLAMVSNWAPTLITRGVFDHQTVERNDPVIYAAGVASAYVSTFVALFFNVALAACAARSMRGEDTKVRDGLAAAARRIGPILGWAVVSTTFGLLLRAFENRVPLLGKIAAGIAGAAWGIATFFVVPVIALEGTGPLTSLKHSAAIIKARWGEGATGAATIGLVTVGVSFAIVMIAVFGVMMLLAGGQALLAYLVLAVAVVLMFGAAVVSATLSQIFRVAVYEFALHGQTPGGFDGPQLQAAFQPHPA
jgi:type IV secretory pathway VirB6-like protein